MFLAPLVTMYIHATLVDDIEFRWMPLLHMWDGVVLMLIAFLIHNQFLAPILIHKRNIKMYVIGVFVLGACFSLYQCAFSQPKHQGPQHIEKLVNEEGDTLTFKFAGKDGEFNNPKKMPPPELVKSNNKDSSWINDLHYSPIDLIAIMLLLFILASNLGLKWYYLNRTIVQRKKELEQEKIQQELSYLKYQVNPHFLMNTLNNIHALVDIDPEKAKLSIVKLSHMLRYMLYDGAKSTIPLDRGIVFLNNYIDLMRIRYEDQVEIVFDTPDPVPNVNVLPLLVISFLENAFKHGVSYVEPSYIHAAIRVENDHLIFECANSKHSDKKNAKIEHGGFGVANVIKRLDLIFGKNYDFNINEDDTTYKVTLAFPLKQIHDNN